MSDRNRNALNLDQARKQTPPVNPVEAMRRQLALAVFGAVKEDDLTSMVEVLKKQAQGGDLKAMKLYFELVGVMGKNQAPPPSAGDNAARQIAEALQDLADEIRVTRAREDRPKRLPAGESNGGG